MKNFQNKGKVARILQSKVFLTFLAVVVFFFFLNMFDIFNRMKETAENMKIAENKVADLEQSKANLDSAIIQLQTEAGIEKSIREKFGLVKEGENLIVVVEDKNTENTESKLDSPSFWSFLKDWFK